MMFKSPVGFWEKHAANGNFGNKKAIARRITDTMGRSLRNVLKDEIIRNREQNPLISLNDNFSE
jgi:hypothetical protein